MQLTGAQKPCKVCAELCPFGGGCSWGHMQAIPNLAELTLHVCPKPERVQARYARGRKRRSHFSSHCRIQCQSNVWPRSCTGDNFSKPGKVLLIARAASLQGVGRVATYILRGPQYEVQGQRLKTLCQEVGPLRPHFSGLYVFAQESLRRRFGIYHILSGTRFLLQFSGTLQVCLWIAGSLGAITRIFG